jgi:KUP system potassium uptake protein
LCAQEFREQHQLDIDLKKVSFFVGREFISYRYRSPMPMWRRALSKFLFHSSSSAIEFFKIPVDRVIELGIRVEL